MKLTDIFNLKTNNISPKKGRILISEPFSNDEMFKHSVVFLTEYSKKGAMGFVLNKFVDDKKFLEAVKKEFLGNSIDISLGGPVSLDRLFTMYVANKNIVEGSIEILPGLYWGGNLTHLRELIISDILPIENVRLFSGYSGWQENQLENEIKENYWLVKDITPTEVITIDENIWTNQIKQLEEKYKTWTLVPENPQYN